MVKATPLARQRPESPCPLLNNVTIGMQATEILTSLRSEKPNASSFKAPAIDNCCLFKGGSLTILTSLRSERPELLSRDQTKQGDWGERVGAALTTLTSLRSERSGTATETEQETRKHGDKKKDTNTR